MMKSKRNYKDSLFVHMFARNVNAKEYFLSLYNALHGTNLKIGEVTIKPVTLSNTVYTGLENDVAMQIDDAVVVLIEQQSTINENMPFRCLEYVTALYSAMFKNEEKYKKKRLNFPCPEFYVFYNGKEPYPAQKVMKLSDSFPAENPKNLPEEILLELSVKVINLNSEKNLPFIKKCLPLESYTKFVQYVIFYKESGEKSCVAKAFKRCEEEGLLPDYFSELEKEEQTMIFGEYSYEDDIRVQRNEAYNEGIEKGIARQKAEDEKLLSRKDARIAELESLLAKSQESQKNAKR